MMAVFKFDLQLHYADFQLKTGEVTLPLSGVTAIFGPSGCGKSSLIRALAGLERAKGWVRFGETVWQDERVFKPVHQRRIGMVFQDGGLLPHLTVQQNLSYALKRSTLPKNQANRWIEQFQLQPLLHQMPATLSGGQVQRVAIVRALLSNAKILMLDEPMSALDWQSKYALLPLIKQVAETVPVLLISHSPDEVERLADRLLLMEQGRVLRVCDLQAALAEADSLLFDDRGAVSVLCGRWAEQTTDASALSGILPLQLGASNCGQAQTSQILWVPLTEDLEKVVMHSKSSQVRVRILAREVSLSLSMPLDLSIVNHLQAEILALIPKPSHKVWVKLALQDGQILFSEITAYSCQRLGLAVGMMVFALIKSVVVTV